MSLKKERNICNILKMSMKELKNKFNLKKDLEEQGYSSSHLD